MIEKTSAWVATMAFASVLSGCSAAEPDSSGGRRELDTTTELELAQGLTLAAAVATETSTVYFLDSARGIDMLEIGDLTRFEPVLARVASRSTPLEIYLALTGTAAEAAPEPLVAGHRGASAAPPRAASFLSMAALHEEAAEALSDPARSRLPFVPQGLDADGFVDKAAPARLTFTIGNGAPADCTLLNALFLGYYGQISASGIEPTYGGCNSPNVCFTTGSSTFSESGVGQVRTASGCNGKTGRASINMLTEKNAPFCPPCPPALPYLGPRFSLNSGQTFLYVEAGGDFAGDLSVSGSGSGSGMLVTIAMH